MNKNQNCPKCGCPMNTVKPVAIRVAGMPAILVCTNHQCNQGIAGTRAMVQKTSR